MIRGKAKKKIRQKNLELHHNQTRLNRVLAALGVTELHKTLHPDFREYVLNNPDLPLVLEHLGSVEFKHLSQRLREWKGLSYKGISGSDFVEVMFPLIRHLGSAVGHGLMAKHNNHKFREVSKGLFLQYITPAEEFLNYFMDRLTAIMQITVWEETAPDQRYVRTEFEINELPRSRVRFKVTVNVESFKRVWICGGWKYRIGTYYDETLSNALSEIKWLSKCPLAYGLPGEVGENLPVYISSHALDRIRERLDDRWVRVVTMFALYFTMDKPVYHPLNDDSGDMLVELRVKGPDMKLGYLVVSRTRNEIIIKTFLFLTMYQTPEGNKLHRRLRMARPDYDFHKLENYSTLANSDLTTHPKLRPLWEECGFGGLLTLIDGGFKIFDTKQKKQAEDMIRYFRLEET
jgi:hypothetical protein